MSTLISRALTITKLGDPRKNKIEGAYPGSESPKIGGSEAVGIVEKAGSSSTFQPGDSVIPIGMGGDLWSEYDVVEDENLIKIRSDIDLISAATLLINPPTAYVMLKHFVELNPGDYIIQNSANSGVGRAVIEIAHAWGYKSINLIRDRPNVDELKEDLKNIGANFVFTEEEFRKENRKISAEYDIKLALNGVGGRSALAISAVLAPGGTIVTYGGMSKKPAEIPTSAFVFKGIRAFGVAVGKWMCIEENRPLDLILQGKLHPPPVETHDLENFHAAIDQTLEGKNRKQVLLIHPDYKKYIAKL
uniref:Enoyl reductase (ER) domain-containing protein n=1 Tax=Panagrolaimus sp. ES5 TaxID=591445 RepID=A0AC34FQW7_9BILA